MEHRYPLQTSTLGRTYYLHPPVFRNSQGVVSPPIEGLPVRYVYRSVVSRIFLPNDCQFVERRGLPIATSARKSYELSRSNTWFGEYRIL